MTEAITIFLLFVILIALYWLYRLLAEWKEAAERKETEGRQGVGRGAKERHERASWRRARDYAEGYSVSQSNDGGWLLVNKENSEDTVRVRRTAFPYALSGTVTTVGRAFVPEEQDWISLRNPSLDVTIFGLSEDTLTILGLDEVAIFERSVFEQRNEDEQQEDRTDERYTPDENGVTGRAFWIRGLEPGDPDHVRIEIGVPGDRFHGLLNSCLTDRLTTINMTGLFGGYTASYFFEDRPLILIPGERTNLGAESLSVAYPREAE